MAEPKIGGNRGNAGKGRPKGSPNKNTTVIKDAITHVYADLQKDSGEPHGHFKEWAKGQPTEFYKLASKLIPIQVGGDPDNPLITEVRRSIVRPGN